MTSNGVANKRCPVSIVLDETVPTLQEMCSLPNKTMSLHGFTAHETEPLPLAATGSKSIFKMACSILACSELYRRFTTGLYFYRNHWSAWSIDDFEIGDVHLFAGVANPNGTPVGSPLTKARSAGGPRDHFCFCFGMGCNIRDGNCDVTWCSICRCLTMLNAL